MISYFPSSAMLAEVQPFRKDFTSVSFYLIPTAHQILDMQDPTDATPSGKAPPTLHHLFSSQSLRILWALEELSAANSQPYSLKTYKRQKGTAPPRAADNFSFGRKSDPRYRPSTRISRPGTSCRDRVAPHP